MVFTHLQNIYGKDENQNVFNRTQKKSVVFYLRFTEGERKSLSQFTTKQKHSVLKPTSMRFIPHGLGEKPLLRKAFLR